MSNEKRKAFKPLYTPQQQLNTYVPKQRLVIPGAAAFGKYDDNWRPGINQESNRARNQGFFGKWWGGIRSRGLSIGVKMGEGLAMAANIPEALKEGDITKIWNNANLELFRQADENLRKMFPVHKQQAYQEGNLIQRMGTPEFWAEDFLDGVAFLASAYVPGLAATKLGQAARIGIKAQKYVQKGLGFSAVGYNTFVESSVEASSTYKEVLARLMPQVEAGKLTAEQAKKIAGTASIRTFTGNMFTLGLPNFIQYKMFFGGFDDVSKQIRKTVRTAEKGKEVKTAVKKFASRRKEILKNIASEGFFEENVQTALATYEQQLLDNNEYYTNYLDFIGDVATNALTSVNSFVKAFTVGTEAHSLEDEQATSIALGALIGGGSAAVSTTFKKGQVRRAAQQELDIWDAFKRFQAIAEEMYVDDNESFMMTEEDEDGNRRLVLDQNNQPIINPKRLMDVMRKASVDRFFTESSMFAALTGDKGAHEFNRRMAASSFAWRLKSIPNITEEDIQDLLELNFEQLPEDQRDPNFNIRDVKDLVIEYLDLYSEMENQHNLIDEVTAENPEEVAFNKAYTRTMFFLQAKKRALQGMAVSTPEAEESKSRAIADVDNDIKKFSNRAAMRKDFVNSITKRSKLKEEARELTAKKDRTSEEDTRLNQLLYEIEEIYETEAFYEEPIFKGEGFLTAFTDKFRSNIPVDNKPRNLREEYLDVVARRQLIEQDILNDIKGKAPIANVIAKAKESDLPLSDSTMEAINEYADSLRQESVDMGNAIQNYEKDLEELEDARMDILEEDPDPYSNPEFQAITESMEKTRGVAEELKAEKTQVDNLLDELDNLDDLLENKSEKYGEFSNGLSKPNLSHDVLVKHNLQNKTKAHNTVVKEAKRLKESFANPRVLDLLQEAKDLRSWFEQRTDLTDRYKKQILDYLDNLIKELEEAAEIFQENKDNILAKQDATKSNIRDAIRRVLTSPEIISYLESIGIDITEYIEKIDNYEPDPNSKEGFDVLIGQIIKNSFNEQQAERFIITLKNKKRELSSKLVEEQIVGRGKRDLGARGTIPNKSHRITKELDSDFSINPSKYIYYMLLSAFPDRFTKEAKNDRNNLFARYFLSRDFSELLFNVDNITHDLTEDEVEALKAIGEIYYEMQAVQLMEGMIESDLSTKDIVDVQQSNYDKQLNKKNQKHATKQQVLSLYDVLLALTAPIKNWKNLFSNTILVEGIYGSGKTSMVAKLAMDALIKLKIYKKEDFYAIGHSDNSSKVINESLGLTNKTLENFLSENVSNTKVLIIDEAWAFNNILLNAVMKKAKKHNIKVLALGDPSQTKQERNPAVGSAKQLFVKHATPISVVLRAKSSAITSAAGFFQFNNQKVRTLGTLLSNDINEFDSQTVGVAGVNAGNVKQLIAKDTGRSKLIIVNRESDKQRYSEFANNPNVRILTYNEAQGSEADEVYVDLNPDGLNQHNEQYTDHSEFNSDMATAISRGKSFVAIVNQGSLVANHSILPAIAEAANSFEDQLEANREMLEQSLETYKHFLRDFAGIIVTSDPEDFNEPSDTPIEEDPLEEEDEQNLPDDNTEPETEPDPPIRISNEQNDRANDAKKSPLKAVLKFANSRFLKTDRQAPDRGVVTEGATAFVVKVKTFKPGDQYVVYGQLNNSELFAPIAIISGEEMTNPMFSDLPEIASNIKGNLRIGDLTGFKSVDELSPYIMKSFTVSESQPLQYNYSSSSRKGVIQALKDWTAQFFYKGDDYEGPKQPYFRPASDTLTNEAPFEIKIFTHMEKEELNDYGQYVSSGVPYIVITNPQMKGVSGNVNTQYIRLNAPNLAAHSPITKQLSKLKENVEKLSKDLRQDPNEFFNSKPFVKLLGDYAKLFKKNPPRDKITGEQSFNSFELKEDADKDTFIAESGLSTEGAVALDQIFRGIYGYKHSVQLMTEEEYDSLQRNDLVKFHKLKGDTAYGHAIIYKDAANPAKGTKKLKTHQLTRGEGSFSKAWSSLVTANNDINGKSFRVTRKERVQLRSGKSRVINKVSAKALVNDSKTSLKRLYPQIRASILEYVRYYREWEPQKTQNDPYLRAQMEEMEEIAMQAALVLDEETGNVEGASIELLRSLVKTFNYAGKTQEARDMGYELLMSEEDIQQMVKDHTTSPVLFEDLQFIVNMAEGGHPSIREPLKIDPKTREVYIYGSKNKGGTQVTLDNVDALGFSTNFDSVSATRVELADPSLETETGVNQTELAGRPEGPIKDRKSRKHRRAGDAVVETVEHDRVIKPTRRDRHARTSENRPEKPDPRMPTSIDEFLKDVIKNGSKEHVTLAKTLIKLGVNDSTVDFTNIENGKNITSRGEDLKIRVNISLKGIKEIREKTDEYANFTLEETIRIVTLHELVHTVTMDSIYRGEIDFIYGEDTPFAELYKNLNRLLNSVKRHYGIKFPREGVYSITDEGKEKIKKLGLKSAAAVVYSVKSPLEIVTEILTNPEVRKAWDKVKVNKITRDSKNRSVLQYIQDLITELYNHFNPTNKSALKYALDVTFDTLSLLEEIKKEEPVLRALPPVRSIKSRRHQEASVNRNEFNREGLSDEDSDLLDDIIYDLDDVDNYEEGNTVFSTTSKGKLITKTEARRRVQKMLPGLQITDNEAEGQLRFLENIYDKHTNNPSENIWGQVSKAILRMKAVGNLVYDQVLRHEVFHVVYKYMLDDVTKEKLRKEVIKHYPEANQRNFEEALAELFQDRSDRTYFERVTPTWLQKLANQLTQFFGIVLFRGPELNKIFDNIEKGRYSTEVNDTGATSSNISFIRKHFGDVTAFKKAKNFLIKKLHEYYDSGKDGYAVTKQEAFNYVKDDLIKKRDFLEKSMKRIPLNKRKRAHNLLKTYNTLLSFNRNTGKPMFHEVIKQIYPSLDIVEVDLNDPNESIVDQARKIHDIIDGIRKETQDVAEVNYEQRQSDAVKDFLSFIPRYNRTAYKQKNQKLIEQGKFVNSRFAFVQTIEFLINMDLNDYSTLQKQFDYIDKNMPLNADSEAVLAHLQNLLLDASEEAPISNAAIVARQPDLTTTKIEYYLFHHPTKELEGKSFEELERMAAKDKSIYVNRIKYNEPLVNLNKDNKISADVFNQLYFREEARNTLRDLQNTLGSMKETQYTILTHKRWGKENTVDYIKARSLGVHVAIKDTVKLKLYNLFTKGTYINSKSDLSAPVKSLIRMLDNEPAEGLHKFYKLIELGEEFAEIKLKNQAKLVEDVKGLLNQFSSVQKEEDIQKDFGEIEVYDDEGNRVPDIDSGFSQWLADNNNRINNIVNPLAKSSRVLRNSSVMSASGSKVYKYHLSNYMSNILNAISKYTKAGQRWRNLPEYLTSEIYKFNPFVYSENKPLNKIHNVITHDQLKSLNSNSSKKFLRQTQREYMLLNFSGAFLNWGRGKRKRYIQYLYQQSDKPRPMGAEINIQDPEQIKRQLALLVDQHKAMPDLTDSYKKYNHNWINAWALGDLVYIYPNKSSQEIAEIAYEELLEVSEEFTDALIDNKVMISSKFDSNSWLNYIPENLKENWDGIHSVTSLRRQDGELNYTLTKKDLLPLAHVFVTNHYVNSYFLTQLVSGHSNFYGSGSVQVKRMSGPVGPGQSPLIGTELGGMEKKFNVLIASDESASIGNIEQQLADILYGGEPRTEQQKVNLVELVKMFPKKEDAFDVTDAQAFMSYRRYGQLKKGYGRGFKLSTIMKPQFFGVEMLDTFIDGEMKKLPVPVYGKNSTIVITPELRKKYPELANLEDRMNQYNIGEVWFGSGTKTGVPKNVGTLSNFGAISENMSVEQKRNASGLTFRTLELSNANYRMQLNPRSDSDKNVSLFSQLLYFMNILHDPNNPKESKAKTAEMYQALARLYHIGYNDWLKEVGNLRSFLIDAFKNSTIDARIHEFLLDGVSHNNPAVEKKAVIQIASALEKLANQVKFPGGKYQLQATFGVKRQVGEGPLKYYRDENNRLVAEVIIPSGLLTKEQEERIQLGKLLDSEFADLLGFRIPSTELHSALALKVVGIYDSKGTNSIIAPDLLVGIHGSDFDGDALFVIRPERIERTYSYIDSNLARHVNDVLDTVTNRLKEIDSSEERRAARELLELIESAFKTDYNKYDDFTVDPAQERELNIFIEKKFKELLAKEPNANEKEYRKNFAKKSGLIWDDISNKWVIAKPHAFAMFSLALKIQDLTTNMIKGNADIKLVNALPTNMDWFRTATLNPTEHEIFKKGARVGYINGKFDRNYEIILNREIRVVTDLIIKIGENGHRPLLSSLNAQLRRLNEIKQQYLRNLILNNMLDAITHESNHIRMLTPINKEIWNGVDGKGDYLEGTVFKMLRDAGFINLEPALDLSNPMDAYEAFKAVADGASLTGIEANNIKSVAYMMRTGSATLLDAQGKLAQLEQELTEITQILNDPEGVSVETLAKLQKESKEKLEEKDKQEKRIAEIEELLMNGTLEELEELDNVVPVSQVPKLNGISFNTLSEVNKQTQKFIWNTLDSLVNIAIDNENDQILSKINANNYTGNLYAALLSVGMDVKDIVASVMQEPVVKMINSSDVTSTPNLISAIKKEMDKLLKKNPEFADREFDLSSEDLLRELNLNNENTDWVQYQNLDNILKGLLLGESLQKMSSFLNVVRSMPVTMEDMMSLMDAYNEIFTTKTEIPAPFQEMDEGWVMTTEITADSTQEKFSRKVFETASTANIHGSFAFNIPLFFKMNPHIDMITRIFKSMMEIVQDNFFIHSSKIQKLANDIHNGGLKMDFIDSNKSKVMIAREVMQYIYRRVLPENVFSSELTIRTKSNVKIQLKGPAAWSQDFIIKVNMLKDKDRELQNSDPNYEPNLFLADLTTDFGKSGKRQLRFTNALSPTDDDIYEYQENFKNLKNFKFEKNDKGRLILTYSETPGIEYNDIQKDFLIYSVLNFGANFGGTDYALALPPDLIGTFNDQLDWQLNMFNQKGVLEEFIDHIKVNLIIGNSDKVRDFIRPGEATLVTEGNDKQSKITIGDKEVENRKGFLYSNDGKVIFYDRVYEVVPGTERKVFPKYITTSALSKNEMPTVYERIGPNAIPVKVSEDGSQTVLAYKTKELSNRQAGVTYRVYYKKMGSGSYNGYDVLDRAPYSKDKHFNKNTYYLSVPSLKEDILESIYDLRPVIATGQSISLILPSDTSRQNQRIVSLKFKSSNEKGTKFKYDVIDYSDPNDTVSLSKQEILDSARNVKKDCK